MQYKDFDICFVTYNSSKWIDMCIDAVSRLDYDLKKLNLVFVDNASSDDTVSLLKKRKTELEDRFAGFSVICEEVNRGFGAGNNIAARQGSAEYLLLLNVDTEIDRNALKIVSDEIDRHGLEYAVFEMRQMPSEHCKYYDPVTMETFWANGACVAVRRDVFFEVGGFDESIFMYCEDVDLSWNIRSHGYKIRYVPEAVVNHYTNNEDGTPKISEQIGSFAGRLILSYKYGSDDQVRYQETTVRKTLALPANGRFADALNARLESISDNKARYRRFYDLNIRENSFIDGDASIKELDEIRSGAFEKTEFCERADGIDFSVVVRTYRRPQLLALTLESLTNQVYRNFDVIVIEDGEEPSAENTAERFRSRLNIGYKCLGYHGGRSRAANAGVSMAAGRYICFLDDDDYFFADHLETMAYLIKQDPGKQMYALGCMEGKIALRDESDPTSFVYVEKSSWIRNWLTRDYFFFDNPLPIQSIVFTKGLFEKVGGVDETLEAFEDWDLWMRMLLETDIVYMDKATSIFKTPYDAAELEKREAFMGPYRPLMKQKAEEYREKAGIAYMELTEFYPDESRDENILKVIRPYREEESSIDVFSEIKRTKKWLLSLPARIAVAGISKLRKHDPDGLSMSDRFGPVIWPWKNYTKAERENMVDTVLTSDCWKWI